jgi:hypothetical protein
MATAYLREYADIAHTFSKTVQAGAEPAIADQTITTSGTSAASNAFDANTRVICISTPAAQAVCALFSATAGATPTALVTSLRLPANSMIFFGVKPGDKVALIDVT